MPILVSPARGGVCVAMCVCVFVHVRGVRGSLGGHEFATEGLKHLHQRLSELPVQPALSHIHTSHRTNYILIPPPPPPSHTCFLILVALPLVVVITHRHLFGCMRACVFACVCVCVCARARTRACVTVCACFIQVMQNTVTHGSFYGTMSLLHTDKHTHKHNVNSRI